MVYYQKKSFLNVSHHFTEEINRQYIVQFKKQKKTNLKNYTCSLVESSVVYRVKGDNFVSKMKICLSCCPPLLKAASNTVVQIRMLELLG